jgi:peroxiredoxin
MKRTALLLLLCLALAARGDDTITVLPAGGGTIRTSHLVGGGTIRISGGGTLQIGAGAGAFRIVGGKGGGAIVFHTGAPGASPEVDATPSVPTLRWKNGETLPGDLAGASGNDLLWKSPLFADPLQIQWNVIDRIDWPTAASQLQDPFAIALRDGSFIYGDIAAIGANSISIHSTRHGDAELKRAEVLSITRRQNARLIYGGPTGDLGWEAMANQQDGSVLLAPGQAVTTSPVTTGPGGALLIRSWNRSAFLNITLPASVDVEFRLHSSKRPEFLVALGGNVHDPLRLETWDNRLVLSSANDIQSKLIRIIQDDERTIALRVCWNAKTGDCSVFSPSGEELTSWKVPGNDSPPEPGFIVQNRGLDLSIDTLRVRAWDGKAPAKSDPKQACVELDDGRRVAGTIVSAGGGLVSVLPAGQAGAASFPLASVDALIFSSDSPQVPAHAASLAFNDATLLYGHLAGLANGRATFDTSFTSQPLFVRMDSPRQLLNASTNAASAASPTNPSAASYETPPASPGEPDTLSILDTTLHGKLGAEIDGSLGWLPVGGVKPARPADGVGWEITRAAPKDAPLPADPALFYLTSGDILPGSLQSLDRTGADFTSSLMDARKLPAAQLEAIEFSPPTHLDVQSFSAPEWQIVKGDEKSVRRVGNAVELDNIGAIGMESLMECGEFSFKYNNNGFSAARVRLFCAGKDETNSLNLILCGTGGQFTVGQETTPGQMTSQFQVRTQPGTPAAVRFKLENDAVELFVNDTSVGQFPIDSAKYSGSGVIIEPASVWGNGIFTVSLSDFSAKPSIGRAWLPEVSDDIRKQVLTVPRFERDDPPRHLLLAANGDVLRGEIEAATDTHFGFRCGLEELNVPRDRVRAVIWLQPPAKEAPGSAAASPDPTPTDDQPAANPLDDRLEAQIRFQQTELAGVLDFLRSQDHGLNIQPPDGPTPRLKASLQLGSETVAEALTQICAQFDLHYRLDPDNTVVLELPTTQSSGGMIAKTYWIKPDALPATGTARDILSAKGITFPKDAAVEWSAPSGVLTMVNTDTNQTKLAALIASDFGGILGSPTHWIELTGGGRLALAVDKFEPDFILAHQPDYGAIKVPMAQVAVIRTTAPQATAASRALADWQLVNAPEPALAAGGGGNSPLLGKDAPTFSLPLLDGDSFDLAAQKGHIVVLDFWASWCGPCARSLPGIIDLVAGFSKDKVELVGINEGEAPEQVKRFLAARGLKLTVAMDADQSIGRKYGVDAIPRTLIIGPDGKVVWDHTGYDPDAESSAADIIKKLLNPPMAADPPGH